MWGTLGLTACTSSKSRITPTCVGNTPRFFAQSGDRGDHPHLCGEHACFFCLLSFTWGSPPPVWGTQKWTKEDEEVREDHPHLCGEHITALVSLYGLKGSPPPVWGTLLSFTWLALYARITPTCVGNTVFNFCVISLL